MLRAHGLTLYEPDDLRVESASAEIEHLREILAWAVTFLNVPNHRLGRRGAVCPYTSQSMEASFFLLASAGGEHDVQSIEALVDRYRRWFIELVEQSDPAHKHLLTILLVLPGFDRTDARPLDALQRRLKDAFVREGLMLGQFHLECEQTGLWNDDFRPLRAPIPVLAIRQMVGSDLPFLLESAEHLSAYLDRFASGIPRHVRRLLVARVTGEAGPETVAA